MILRRSFFLLPCAALAKEDPTWIAKLGGFVQRNAAGDITAVRLANTWVNDAELIELARFPHLERLDLTHTRISDDGMLHLRPARQIRDLNLLYAEQVTDQGMNAIKEWKQLRRLNVRGTRIADGTLAIAGRLTDLEFLDIANTASTDTGLDNLVGLTKLKYLGLGRTRLSDPALAALRLLNTLESLDLSGPPQGRQAAPIAGSLPDNVTQCISELKQLRTLRLGHSPIAAPDLKILAAALPNTQKLGLEMCPKVDDAALKVLADWKSLRYLDVQATAVTEAGAKSFASARPDVKLLR
ncbi:MAG: hypothetical protein IT168_03835 [Bryobacterales bacterium]|nr:hypothetical protein [Bryobacterales bacterium]